MKNYDFNAVLKNGRGRHGLRVWGLKIRPLGGPFGLTIVSKTCFQQFRAGTLKVDIMVTYFAHLPFFTFYKFDYFGTCDHFKKNILNHFHMRKFKVI